MRWLAVFLLVFSTHCFGADLLVAAFGDSISQGTNSVVLGSNPRRSWATGDKVNSHAQKLAAQGNNVSILNLSQNGAESSDLLNEIAGLGNLAPDYATVLIGANDVCNGFHPGTAQNVRTALAELTRRNPSMEIVLVPIPKLLSLFEAGDQFGSCRRKWNLFNICSPMLGRNLSDAERADAQARIDSINDELGAAAAAFPQVRFDRGVGNIEFNIDDVGTIDCFHPSVEGQELISDLTF